MISYGSYASTIAAYLHANDAILLLVDPRQSLYFIQINLYQGNQNKVRLQ